jgi:hypothetical protein
MRRNGIALVAVGCTALLSILATASASYVEHPTIHEFEAFEDARHFLAQNYPGWRTRAVGYIDCRHGRINRYIWSCGVGWARGRNCWQGRTRISNEYREGNVVHYQVNFNSRRC